MVIPYEDWTTVAEAILLILVNVKFPLTRVIVVKLK